MDASYYMNFCHEQTMADLNLMKILKWALLSRLLSLLVQCVSNNLIPDYDSSAEECSSWENITAKISSKSRDCNSFAEEAVYALVGGNAKWDAVYFLDIAKNGYQYEQNMAFFPLLPLLVHYVGRILNSLTLFFDLHQRAVLVLAATVLNTSAFTIAALGLFCLTKTIFLDQKLASRTVLFFCFSPASVFFSATYSESIFAMVQFWGMFFLESEPCSFLMAAFLFSLGSGARSNGIISTGFIGYKLMKQLLDSKFKKGKASYSAAFILSLLLAISQMLLLALMVLMPFIAFQYYGYKLFCNSVDHPPWCKQHIPIPYTYIQKTYWNVGFLKYFEFKQLPNFLLAIPVVGLGSLGICECIRSLTWADILSLGFLTTKSSHSPNLFVYAVHLGFLLLFGVTSMHVQVVTRFVASSSPVIYWVAALWTTPQQNDKSGTKMRLHLKSNFVVLYFLLYYWIGFVLHCNFYPWT